MKHDILYDYIPIKIMMEQASPKILCKSQSWHEPIMHLILCIYHSLHIPQLQKHYLWSSKFITHPQQTCELQRIKGHLLSIWHSTSCFKDTAKILAE